MSNIDAMYAVSNRATTTLDGAITDSDTTITVDDGSVFPASGPFKVTIGSEIIDITSRATNDLSVGTRGVEGTTPAPHLSGVAVAMNFTAGHFEALRDGIVRYPSADAGPSGVFSTDDPILSQLRRHGL
jgi:hypothetical protein